MEEKCNKAEKERHELMKKEADARAELTAVMARKKRGGEEEFVVKKRRRVVYSI